MTEDQAVKKGEFIGHLIAGGFWGIYIGGILSMIGHTFITPLPITSFFIMLFGLYAVFMTVFIVALMAGMGWMYRKDATETLRTLWKTKLHEKGMIQLNWGVTLACCLSVFSLFVMKDMSLFIKIFSNTVASGMLLSQMKGYIKHVKEHEAVFKFSDNIKGLQDIIKKINKKK